MAHVNYFLCSFHPLSGNPAGQSAVARAGLPPFIDGSCRREPDFQPSAPSISALCRTTQFAPRLWPGDGVAYITNQGRYNGEAGWALVALLNIMKRFESHEAAAEWYRTNGFAVPSNCLVPGNPPQPYHLTNQKPPDVVAERVDTEADPERAVRLWDSTYAKRAKECGVFLACEVNFLELWHPPVLRRSDFHAIFGRVPGTQNPPKITPDQFRALANHTKAAI
jgi:hypothetical protein